MRIPETVNDDKQAKVKFNRKSAKDKLNSILYDDKVTEKRFEKDLEREGEILFDNFDFNYFADGPLVLRSMNFQIHPGEKIGIGKLMMKLNCNGPTSKAPGLSISSTEYSIILKFSG